MFGRKRKGLEMCWGDLEKLIVNIKHDYIRFTVLKDGDGF